MKLNTAVMAIGFTFGWLYGSSSSAALIFVEDFSSPSLDSAWAVSSQTIGRYSLTENPGNLRYRLDGGWQGASGWWGPTHIWSPTTTLSRDFGGEDWTLDYRVSYHLNSHGPGYSTGVQATYLYVAFDSDDYVAMGRAVDWWYDQATNPLGYVAFGARASSGTVTRYYDSRDPLVVGGTDINGWISGEQYYRLARSASTITGFISQNGVSYRKVFEADFGSAATSLQTIYLDGVVWQPSGSHVDYDYIQLESVALPVPEPELASVAVLILGLGCLVGCRRTSNASSESRNDASCRPVPHAATTSRAV